MGPEDIVTCTLHNNFDYDPGINLVKTASEDVVRGDNGGTSVTYTRDNHQHRQHPVGPIGG